MKHRHLMDLLKPTVKRDISLFSALSWQKGYHYYFKQKFGWSYLIYLQYNGRQVNHFHKDADFKYFKQEITQNLISDDQLFNKLNIQFQKDVFALKTIKVTPKNLPKISNLIGKVMSFYIFVVSDTFVTARPKAWESRNLSQEVLYEVDEKVEYLLKQRFITLKIPEALSHLITPSESITLFSDLPLSNEKILERQAGYILHKLKVITHLDFPEFCRRQKLINPEEDVQNQLTNQLTGTIACTGFVVGKAKIIHAARHLAKIQEGDILIAPMTNVNYTSAILKSAAIITDEGGITSHAAIVARELKKPCIIGTKVATQIFHDGDLLKVDANSGIISRIP
jgi:phosphohistidine swiveling domain-containing protein